MKVSINPKADLAVAPSAVKTVYMLMWGMSIFWVLSQIVATIQGLNFLFLVGSLFLGYLVIDTGLVVLRGRAMAKGLTTFFSFAVIVASVLTYLHIMAGDIIVFGLLAVSAVLGLITIIMVNSKKVKAYIAEKSTGSVIVNTRKEKRVKSGITPGSWDDIMAQQAAEEGKE